MMYPKKGINDPQPEKSNEDNTRIGRTYECTFCKRGFTNAQALGGHMNIHRKDKDRAKAKAKRKNQEETSMKDNLNSQNFPRQISSNDQQYYGLMGSHMNYQMYFQSPNPNFQIGDNYGTNVPVLRPDDQYEDENLSLRIGLLDPTVGNDEDDENVKENDEVDLELRLGHDS